MRTALRTVPRCRARANVVTDPWLAAQGPQHRPAARVFEGEPAAVVVAPHDVAAAAGAGHGAGEEGMSLERATFAWPDRGWLADNESRAGLVQDSVAGQDVRTSLVDRRHWRQLDGPGVVRGRDSSDCVAGLCAAAADSRPGAENGPTPRLTTGGLTLTVYVAALYPGCLAPLHPVRQCA